MAQSSQDEDFFASSPPAQSQGSRAGPSKLPAVDVEAALPPAADEGDGVDAPSLFRGGSVDDQDDDDELIETVRVKKRQKVTQSPVPKQNGAIDAIDLDEDGQGSASPEPQWRRRYIGHFCIAGWSLSKGKGYAEQGAKVTIVRQKPKPPAASPSSAPKAASKKQTKLSFGGGSKAAASAVRAPAKVKQVEDYVVRFSNERGFEVGRLPQEVASWVSKLIDLDIAEFEGYVVDCPPSLTVGCDILLDIKAYLRREAFPKSKDVRASRNLTNEPAKNFFEETAETANEKELRQRKAALSRLFRACDLKPTQSNSLVQQHEMDGKFGSSSMLDHYGGSEALLGNDSPNSQAQKDTASQAQNGTQNGAQTGTQNESATTIVVDGDEDAQPDVNDGTEIEESELAKVYSKAQKHDAELPEVNPPETFALTLRPYQRQALGWMQNMERPASMRQGREGQRQEASLHPLWQEYRFVEDDEGDGAVSSGDPGDDPGHFYFNPYIGEMSMEFQPASHGTRGGILADEMGLGKTIMVASLIHAERGDADGNEDATQPRAQHLENKGPRQTSLASAFNATTQEAASGGRATLVVAPMSLVGQWKSELERASAPGTLSVMLHYGEGRSEVVDRLEGGSVDVVITSYGTLVSEYKRFVDAGGVQASAAKVARSAPLYAVDWLRVILDEAHNIRNRTTRNARACRELSARRRWCLTGSPIVNRLTDLYSLLNFLRVEPWGDFSFFNSFIGKPFANKNPKALEIVQVVLESILLRREKTFKDKDGQPIVSLPSKTVELKHLDFTPVERRIYDLCFERAWLQYQRLREDGTMSRNLSIIFSVLMKLRQAVCHPLLVLKALQESHANARAKQLEAGGGAEVDEEAEAEVHELVQQFQAGGDDDTEDQGAVSSEPRGGALKSDPRGPGSDARGTAGTFRSSTKLDALIADLKALRQSEPTFKGVIFSQFTSFLDLVEVVLKRSKHPFVRLDGTTSQKDREIVLKTFSSTPEHMLILVSLRAGGVGLNLVSANHCWLLDCWWAEAVESQAIDRVHRIGQERAVTVHRYLIKDSIEQRILQIQRRKTALVTQALAGSRGDDGESEGETAENLRILFGDGK